MVMLAGMAPPFCVALASKPDPRAHQRQPMTQLLETAPLLLIALFGVTLAPLCEELAFRGFLQPLLVRSSGRRARHSAGRRFRSGCMHCHEYGNPGACRLISLAGAAFGAMRHATGSTKAAVLMHAAYNSFFFIALMTEKRILPQLW